MKKALVWTALAVLAAAVSSGGAQQAQTRPDLSQPISRLKPDLVPVSINFQDVAKIVESGKTYYRFRIAAKVKNNGPGSSGACQLAIERGSDWHVTVPFLKKPIAALSAGAETTILTDFLKHEVGTPKMYYMLIADIDHTVAETNEGNNASPASPSMPSFPPDGGGGGAF